MWSLGLLGGALAGVPAAGLAARPVVQFGIVAAARHPRPHRVRLLPDRGSRGGLERGLSPRRGRYGLRRRGRRPGAPGRRLRRGRAGGLALALAAPRAAAGILGFTLLGLGLGPVIPTAVSAAGNAGLGTRTPRRTQRGHLAADAGHTAAEHGQMAVGMASRPRL